MRSNVSTVAIVISAALLLAAAPAAYAGVDITGVLSTGSHKVSISNAQFIGDSIYIFPTVGWEGDTMVEDTFVFPHMFGPPSMVLLNGTMDGAPLTIPMAAPKSDSWYIIPGTPTWAKLKLMWPVGIEERSGRPMRPARLTVSPSIVATGTTVRAERVAGTSCVFELFDAAGNRVRTLRTQASSSGAASATWTGEDDLGRKLPEGVYYCCLDDPAGPAVRRLTLVR